MRIDGTKRRREKPRSRFAHWSVPFIIVSLGAMGIIGIHAGWFALSDRPSWDFLAILIAMEVAFAIWVGFFSGIGPGYRVAVIAAFTAWQAGILQTLRLEGFAGDGRPLWTWRWEPPRGHGIDWESRLVREREIDLTATKIVDSPGFRGADRTGNAPTKLKSERFLASAPRMLWRQAIGAGWSSFAVVGDYGVTQEQRGELEAIVCYDLRSGEEVWSHSERARFFEATSDEGPRSTPTIYAGRVYAVGATGLLHCLEGANGKSQWRVDFLAEHGVKNLLFGATASPLVTDSLVIVNPGGNGSALAAYDRDSGKLVWKAGRAQASYSSPQLVSLGGIEQVLDFNAEGLTAHELHGGEILWEIPWVSNPEERNNVAQPLAVRFGKQRHTNHVFISSGYGMGCALLEIARSDERFVPAFVWKTRHLKTKFSGCVIHAGHAYGLDDSFLSCVDLETGERRWKKGRYGFGQILLAGDTILVQCEAGEIALVAAEPREHRELRRFPALTARTWNVPVLAGNRLLVRNDREAICFEWNANDAP